MQYFYNWQEEVDFLSLTPKRKKTSNVERSRCPLPFSHRRCVMLGPFVGAVHRHLKSWSLGPVLQCLDRFLAEPAFRRTLIKKPTAFTRPQSLYSLPVTLKTFLFQPTFKGVWSTVANFAP